MSRPSRPLNATEVALLEVALGAVNGALHELLLESGRLSVDEWNTHVAPRFQAVASVLEGSEIHARTYRVHESIYPKATSK
jgi:hypothetical protein